MRATGGMLRQTTDSLDRHLAEESVIESRLAVIRDERASLMRSIEFHERQLDITVSKVKGSGIVNIRGSEKLDIRSSKSQGKVLDVAVYRALDGIVDAVSRMRQVNRGFSH